MRHLRGKESLAEELTRIPGLPRKALVERWEKAYGGPPPKGISRRLLEFSAAYHLQVKAFGGLKPNVRRKLRLPVNGEKAINTPSLLGRARRFSRGPAW